MSDILSILDTVSCVYRLHGVSGGTDKQEYYEYSSDTPVRLESLSDGDLMFVSGEISQTYKVYAEVDAFRVSDKLYIDGVYYYVENVRVFNQEYSPHIEAVVHVTRANDA